MGVQGKNHNSSCSYEQAEPSRARAELVNISLPQEAESAFPSGQRAPARVGVSCYLRYDSVLDFL